MTKKLLKEWLMGLLIGDNIEDLFKKGEEVKKTANEIIRFLEDYGYFNENVKDK